MKLKVTKTEVWAAQMDDVPGGMARLLQTIASGGANLDCVIARRQADKPGKGVLFVTPLKGRKQLAAAGKAGFKPAGRVATLKVEGANRAGLGAAVTKAIGDAGVNLRGVSAAVVGRNFACYFGFDSPADRAKAEVAVKALARKR